MTRKELESICRVLKSFARPQDRGIAPSAEWQRVRIARALALELGVHGTGRDLFMKAAGVTADGHTM